MNDNVNISAVKKNLAYVKKRTAEELELREAHIFDLAHETLSLIRAAGLPVSFAAAIDSEDVKSVVSKSFCDGTYISGQEDAFSDLDGYMFASALSHYLPADANETARVIFGKEEDNGGETKISLIRNAGSDRAFEIFAAKLHGVGAEYAETFADACASVSERHTKYAIIPLGSLLDGRLDGLYRMMEKYDLSIIMSCRVTSDDGNVTRYALAGKDPARLSGKLKIEFKAALDSARDIKKILGAADWLCAEVERIDALPSQYGRDNTYGFTLEADENDVSRIMLYLSLFFSQYIPLGIYADVSEE